MIPAPFLYNVWVTEVIDGDTIRCRVDRGDYDYSTWTIRLLGVNARELAQYGGYEAKANLEALLPAETRCVLATVKPDKYGGRKVASVAFKHKGAELDLSELLIATGWAAAWDGKGAKPVPVWPREAL